jgi:hypothetical protein
MKWLLACAVALVPTAGAAQGTPDAEAALSAATSERLAPPSAAVPAGDLPEIDGPAAPIAPAVANRDEQGKVTVRAVRLERPLRIDGRIDEEVYQIVPAIADFVQQLPNENTAPTEPTELWIFYDEVNLYLAVRCFDSRPDRITANELRRDNSAIFAGGDTFTFVFDTFYDHRNGFFFQTNPLGAIRDQAVVGGQQLESWNTVWDVKAERFPQGWSAEIVIPFKSLRYRRAGPQVWGFNARRIVKSKNEYSNLSPVPAVWGSSGMYQLGFAATLVGLETPAQSKNLEVKPYVLSSLTTDRAAAVPSNNDITGNVGLDFKYGVSRSLIADVTVNTDFAQVEEDLQQVNLTRFSLFFPEKRDFFLEGQGIFGFGGRRLDTRTADAQDVPVLFFSRRIGLNNGQAVPVVGGARLTGKAGPFDVGLLNIQTASKASAGALATNWSAVRLKRDIFRRSSIGFIATERFQSGGDRNSNLAFGADASLRFADDVTAVGYYAATSSSGRNGSRASYRGKFDYAGDRYGFGLEHLMVGESFDPGVGFLRRTNFQRSSASARFSPRLRRSRVIRKLTWQASIDYITGKQTGLVENRTHEASFGVERHNGDLANARFTQDYELLPSNFTVSPGVVVPAGGYQSNDFELSYTLAQQRKLAGQIAMSGGRFYGGTRRTASYSGRVGLIPQLSVEPGISLNWIELPYAEFMAQVLSTRVTMTPTARFMVSSLVQFTRATNALSSSVRLRWEYVPGSELFVVYSDGRDTSGLGAELMNRSFAIKATRLVRF